MAVANYQEIALPAVGQCLDPDLVIDALNNAEALAASLRDDDTELTCQSVTDTSVFMVEDEWRCEEIMPAIAELDPAAGVSSIVDEKLILLNFRPDLTVTSIGSAQGAQPTPILKVEIRCGDSVLYSGPETQDEPFAKWVFAECPRNQPIEICGIVRGSGGSQSPLEYTVTGRLNVCGAIICVGQVANELTNYARPAPILPGCKVRRESLYQLAQNVNGLCRYLDEGTGRSAQQFTFDLADQGSQVIANNLSDGAIFLAMGSIEVCYRSTSDDNDGYIVVNPSAECVGGTGGGCLSYKIRVDKNNQGDNIGEIQCAKLPVISCGECGPNDEVQVGFVSEFACNSDVITPTEQSFAEIVSIEQKWCVWVFEKEDTSDLPEQQSFRLFKCITDQIVNVFQKLSDLHEYLCNRKPINLTIRDNPQYPVYTLSQAQQPPFPNPIPLKSWNVHTEICPRWAGFYRPNRDIEVTVTVEVKCGGAVVVSDSVTWPVSEIVNDDTRVFTRLGPCLRIHECIECAIDQDLTVEVSETITANPPGTNDSIDYYKYEIEAFCF